MAKEPKDKELATMNYDPEKQYHVELNRVVELPGIVLRPSDHQITISGELANTIKDAINLATELK